MKKTKNFASGITSAISSPLPTNLEGECKKAAKILNGFIDPGQGLDKIIPSSILEKAQGLAIYTVIKAGFLFSGRAGSGLVIARLPDGGWSAPSAIGTGGIGAGGQIGAELTDFVLVLNTREAVKTFSQVGNLTLGGNVSVAAGPIGRNAEASGSASLKHISAVYSYSKTRGLFAGVSLEGSVVVTRSDANEKFYGQRVTPKELMSGAIAPPPEADALYRALNSKFNTLGSETYAKNLSENNGSLSRSQTFKSTHMSAPGTLKSPPPLNNHQAIGYGAPVPPPAYQSPPPPPPPQQQQQQSYTNHYNKSNQPPETHYNTSHQEKSAMTNYYSNQSSNPYTTQAAAKRAPPPPPPSRKPVMPSDPTARALYSFDGQQDGDLSFQEGEIITVTQKTDSQDDWWTGRIGERQGMFPANYVQLQ
ncbi:unnamed protein product [Rhizopus stolonifer]